MSECGHGLMHCGLPEGIDVMGCVDGKSGF